MTTSPIDSLPNQSVEPVDLDQAAAPSPELARWADLTDRPSFVYHCGDASTVIPHARPEWSDPDVDQIGTSTMSSYYRSETAYVIASRSYGKVLNDELIPATVMTRVKMDGDGIVSLSLTLHTYDKTTGWKDLAITLTPAEAGELATVLLAAADLAVSE